MKKIISIIASFLAFSISAAAQNYYFEKSYIATDSQANCCYPQGISASLPGQKAVIFWQDIDESNRHIYLSAKSSLNGYYWETTPRFAGPIEYMGDIPNVFSAASNSKSIVVAAMTSSTQITVFTSNDYFKTFSSAVLDTNGHNFIAPRVFRNSKNEFTMLASLPENESFSIFSSTSRDGTTWSEFSRITATSQIENSYNPIAPYLAPVQGGDLLVYQAQHTQSNLISVQLYTAISRDGGKTFSKPSLITGEQIVPDDPKFYNYNNQFPTVAKSSTGETYIAWERSPFYSTNADIYVAKLNPNGTIKGEAERISTTGYAAKPELFEFNGTMNLLWFTTVSGSRQVYLTTKKGAWWEDSKIISGKNSSMALPLIANAGKDLSFVWEEFNSSKKKTGLAILNTDRSVSKPKISAVNFKQNQKSNSKEVTARVTTTEDSSGIRGFSWIWTKDISQEPPKEVMNSPSDNILKQIATEEGKWYFKARQSDFAGNWSESVTLSYELDTTPPEKVNLDQLSYDSLGFISSNTFTLNWNPSTMDSDIAGYTYTLKYIDSVPAELQTNSRHPIKLSQENAESLAKKIFKANEIESKNIPHLPEYIVSKSKKVNYKNIKNGLYLFCIAAIDEVGNIGEVESLFIPVNKYAPSTYVTSVQSKTNDFGDSEISIIGGGFTYDGSITAIYIDKDGLAPYDYTVHLSSGEYKINSDNRISQIKLKNVLSGDYRIGMMHSDRGLYFSPKQMLKIEEHGTTKIKSDYNFLPDWKFIQKNYKKHLNVTLPVLILLLLIAGIGITVSVRSLADTVKETFAVNAEVKALLEGDIMPQEKKRKATVYKQKGFSLKSKLVLHSSILIAFMDMLIFLGFGYYMISVQKRTLATSLYDRISVMMNSISSGAKIYLPQTTTTDNLSLTDIANQVSALSESRFATITGYSAEHNRTGLDSVWATTDEDIVSKTDSDTFIPGVSRLNVEEWNDILKKCEELNTKAAEEAGDISLNITELTSEGIALASRTDTKSVERRSEIQTIRNQLSSKLDSILNTISTQAEGSFPQFDPANIDTENTDYIFFKPILYRQGNDSNYVHGVILVKISTESLIQQIEHEKDIIIKTCIVVLVLALLLAIFSTYIMASLIVRPIKKLVAHVAMIRDTDDKEKLDGKNIVIESKDEIGMLGDTVNEMTKGLVEAAVQAKNLTMGKDIQTRFIPLEIKDGITLTTGKLQAKGADFFSYYAGADDLSGDYFDYLQIDETHYAIIKCDVSGHGVPAALIMVEVATLFLNYFKNWNMKNPRQGLNISPIVGQINDLIEARGFKGRFAAFTLCIMDTANGDCWFCNAGDNIVHVYDSELASTKIITLQETPAAGMFSTDLVEMKGGYKVSKFKLKHNDVLLLYTDGIEEAKRNFRDDNENIIKCMESGLAEGEIHESHTVGDDNEEMGPDRVTQIIESVYAKRKFKLHKFHAWADQEDFDFDFTTCEGSAEDAIMALVSVEKVFRLYRPKEPKPTDRVKVDKNIDEFLHQHFNQYSEYCSDRQEIQDDPTHIYYCGVKEDPQYDDLTLIAIKKS